MELVLQAFPFLLALSPIVANAMLLMKTFWDTLMKNQFVGAAVNTTLVSLEDTKEVWLPFASKGLMILRPVVKALVLLVRASLHLIIAGRNSLISTFSWLKANGMDMSVALKEFGNSIFVIARTVGKGLYYTSNAVGFMITSVEESIEFVTNPSAMTWNGFVAKAGALSVTVALTGLLIWSLASRCKEKEKPKPKQIESLPERKLRSSVARKRALLYCNDLGSMRPN